MTNTRAVTRARGVQERQDDLQNAGQTARQGVQHALRQAVRDDDDGDVCEGACTPERTGANIGPLKAAVEKGMPTIGTVIDVQWDDRDQWFRGRVTSRVMTKNKTHAKCHIHYDDGDRITHDLNDFCWRVAPVDGRSGPVCRWRLPTYMLPNRTYTPNTPVRATTNPHSVRIQTRGISKQIRMPSCSLQNPPPAKHSRRAKRSQKPVEPIKRARLIKREQHNSRAKNALRNGTALVAFLGECIEADDEVGDSVLLGKCSNERDVRDFTEENGSARETGKELANDIGCKSEGPTIPPSSVSSSISHSSYTPRLSHEIHIHDDTQLPESGVQIQKRTEKDDANLPCRKRSWRLHHFPTDV